MKNTFLVLIAGLVLAANAFAYSSAPAGDPNLGYADVEYKSVVKVDGVTGYEDAISKGHGVFYEDGTGGLSGLYKVSRNYSGTYNTALASKVSACIAARDVASGDTGAFGCVTKGYLDYAKYVSVTNMPITKGDYLCISNLATSLGLLVPCNTGITSPFVALESKGAGTGTIKIAVQAR